MSKISDANDTPGPPILGNAITDVWIVMDPEANRRELLIGLFNHGNFFFG